MRTIAPNIQARRVKHETKSAILVSGGFVRGWFLLSQPLAQFLKGIIYSGIFSQQRLSISNYELILTLFPFDNPRLLVRFQPADFDRGVIRLQMSDRCC
jgi:hypothetical protein